MDNKQQEIEQMHKALTENITYDEWAAREYGKQEVNFDCTACLLVNAGFGNVKNYQEEIRRLEEELKRIESEPFDESKKETCCECRVSLKKDIEKRAAMNVIEKLKEKFTFVIDNGTAFYIIADYDELAEFANQLIGEVDAEDKSEEQPNEDL